MSELEITMFQNEVVANACDKGFHTDNDNIGEKLMLIVSELGEGLEALRKDKRANLNDFINRKALLINSINASLPEEEIQELKQKIEEDCFKRYIKDTFEDELADTFIRLLDLAGYMGIDLEYHVRLKHEFNKTRPYKHGKKF